MGLPYFKGTLCGRILLLIDTPLTAVVDAGWWIIDRIAGLFRR